MGKVDDSSEEDEPIVVTLATGGAAPVPAAAPAPSPTLAPDVADQVATQPVEAESDTPSAQPGEAESDKDSAQSVDAAVKEEPANAQSAEAESEMTDVQPVDSISMEEPVAALPAETEDQKAGAELVEVAVKEEPVAALAAEATDEKTDAQPVDTVATEEPLAAEATESNSNAEDSTGDAAVTSDSASAAAAAAAAAVAVAAAASAAVPAPMRGASDASASASTSATGANSATSSASMEEVTNALAQDAARRSPKFQRCWEAVEKHEWDTDAWMALMTEVQQLPIAGARGYYGRFLTQFPTSGRWWRLFAEHELREKQYERVQEIIKKSLMEIRCPNVDLWRFYLNFTRVVKLDVAVDSRDPAAVAAARLLMVDAFELALERVGGSIHAAPIWQMYLSFAQEDADPQAFLNVRKLFHRAVMVPLLNMEGIWRDYEKFERSIPNNEVLAQNFFKVFRQKFDAARAVLRDRKKLFERINVNALAVPATNLRLDAANMVAWQRVLAYEADNPERLDALRHKSRMRYTFEVFVSLKRYYPEAWYQYAAYENQSNDHDAAAVVLERGLEAMPDSSYLQFALADHHELQGNVQAAKAIYEKMIKENVSALVYVAYQRFARRAFGAKGLSEARAVFKRARKDEREGACTYHVYAASALLEFYSDTSDAGKDIALKIFELGLKKCIQEPAYVLCYLDFLGHLNDDNNMRSLFEKVLAVMPVDVSRPIWDRYVQFEHTMVANGGDLATVAKVEARRALAFPDAPFVETKGLLSVAHRYSFLDLRPASKFDQSFLDMYGASKRPGGSDDAGDAAGDGLGGSGNDGSGFTPEFERLVPGPALPDFLKEFASMLPLHLPWNGPIADAEHVFRAVLMVDFPPRGAIEQRQQQLQQQKQAAEAERKTGGDGDGADGQGVLSKRPAHDVFRSRQQQKLAKLG